MGSDQANILISLNKNIKNTLISGLKIASCTQMTEFEMSLEMGIRDSRNKLTAL